MPPAVRLLIVDDELHVRESLSAWFTEDGYDVSTASGGKEALAILGRRRFDVVITDAELDEEASDTFEHAGVRVLVA